MGSRAGLVERDRYAEAVTHSSEAMRRFARAVEGATTEAGAWKPDDAMVMKEAAMVSCPRSLRRRTIRKLAMRTSMVVAATLCAGCEAYQSVSSRAGTISMMAKSKVCAGPG